MQCIKLICTILKSLEVKEFHFIFELYLVYKTCFKKCMNLNEFFPLDQV